MKSPLIVSQADVWVNCPGSVKMAETYDQVPITDERSEKRRQGQAFDELCEMMIAAGTTDFDELVGTVSTNGIVYDDEMMAAADLYVSDIFETAQGAEQFEVQRRLDLDHIYPGVYGFADCSFYLPWKRQIVIYEAKYGHSFVSEFENWQMILYASAISTEMGIDGIQDQNTTVLFKVVQPRCYAGAPIREWCVTLSDLRGHVNRAKAAAVASFTDNAQCSAGTHCASCDYSHVCRSLQQSVYNGMDHLDDAGGRMLTGTELSVEYRKLKHYEELMKARLSGLEAQLGEELRQGVTGHLYTHEKVFGRRAWSAPRDEIIALAECFEVNVIKDVEPPLITPTQAQKKGIDAGVISDYSERPERGIKLVEINSANMRKVFTRK